MKKKFKVTPGSKLAPKHAPIVGEALARLEDTHGSITPEIVLADARSPKSDLHQFFEWDDGVAAEKWRREEARKLIAAIVVVYEPTGGKSKPQEIRAYYSVSRDEDEPRSFVATARIMSDEKMRAELIANALRDLARWEERYKSLKEFAEVFAAIRKLKSKVRHVA